MAGIPTKKRILIIEDDSSLAETISMKIKEAGFDVFIATDGESGLRMAEEKKPDLILLDLILPRKNGFKFMEEAKPKMEINTIPIVVLTNLESSFDIERALALGARAYLVKANYSLMEVARKVQQILSEQEN